MYRMASGMVPYGSHPDMPEFHGQAEECAGELAELGERARAAGLRLSFHPGQYAVLNDFEVQASVLDAMGLGPEAVVVTHVGGAAGGREAALGRFEEDLALLRLRDQLGERGWCWEEGRLGAPQSLDASARRKSGTRPSPKSK